MSNFEFRLHLEEFNEHMDSISRLTETTSDASDALFELESIKDGMEEANENGGPTVLEDKLIQQRLERIQTTLGIEPGTIEGTKLRREHRFGDLKYRTESIKDWIRTILEWIKKLFSNAKNFFSKAKVSAKKMDEELKEAASRAEEEAARIAEAEEAASKAKEEWKKVKEKTIKALEQFFATNQYPILAKNGNLSFNTVKYCCREINDFHYTTKKIPDYINSPVNREFHIDNYKTLVLKEEDKYNVAFPTERRTFHDLIVEEKPTDNDEIRFDSTDFESFRLIHHIEFSHGTSISYLTGEAEKAVEKVNERLNKLIKGLESDFDDEDDEKYVKQETRIYIQRANKLIEYIQKLLRAVINIRKSYEELCSDVVRIEKSVIREIEQKGKV